MNLGEMIKTVALAAGYEVLSHHISVIEIRGEGDWATLQRACEDFVDQTVYDHVSVIVQSAGGKRELRDVGACGQWGSKMLPSKPHCRERMGDFMGVAPSGRKFTARLTTTKIDGTKRRLYIGSYESKEEAAIARDKYVIKCGANTPLNFPQGD